MQQRENAKQRILFFLALSEARLPRYLLVVAAHCSSPPLFLNLRSSAWLLFLSFPLSARAKCACLFSRAAFLYEVVNLT